MHVRHAPWMLCAGLLVSAPAQADDVQDLKAQIEALKKTIGTLERKIDQLEAQQKSAAVSAAAPPPVRIETDSTSKALGVKPSVMPGRDTIAGQATGASRVDNQAPPDDPDLKGFIPIPGTSTRIRIGGYAKLDAIYDFRDAGDPDQFITAAIPAGEDHVDNGNTNLHAKQTRFSFEVRRPTDQFGNLRFYLENDFFGSSDGYQFRLRHAYGQIGNTYGGYGYTAFMDADALPNTLDFEGPGGQVYVLTASVQQKFPFGDGNSFTLSVEKPEAQVMLADGERALNNMPAVVGAGRIERSWGHLQLGGIVRHLGHMTTDGDKDYVYGGGVSASGSYTLADSDLLLFNIAYGKGIARYIADISGSGYDAAMGDDGKLHALQSIGGYGAYTHYWTSAWSSNLVYGYLKLDNSHGALGDGDFGDSQYAAINLLYSPIPSWTVGTELLYGRLELQGPDDGYATRWQTSIQYNFVK